MNHFKDLILISSETNLINELETVNYFFENTTFTFHLRKPSLSKVEYRNFIQSINEVYHNRIVIHEYHDLISEFKNLKGIHLKEKDREIQIDYKKVISTSFHNIEDAFANSEKFEYFFISPIFKSISKQNYEGNFNEKELIDLNLSTQKSIALGGVSLENIEKLKEFNFRGAGILGAIWLAPNPISELQKFIRLFDRYKF
jgi:thiamine-phosphate pyrophosphorylase